MTEKRKATDELLAQVGEGTVEERIETLIDLTTALTRDGILGAEDLPLVPVEVPEWGGTVWVKPMTAAGRDAFEVAVSDDNGEVDRKNFRAKLVVRTAVTPDGVRLFTDDDAKTIGAKNALPVNRVFEVAARASGLTPEDVAGLEGNSAGRDGDSSID